MKQFNHNMRLLFPASGNGDCIFCLVDKEDGAPLSMMIDCHVFTPEIKVIVTDILNYHLDFLVVTHIDIDHIIYNNLFVEQVDKAQVESLTDFEKEQIKKLRTLIPAWKPRAEHTVAAKESFALSTLIQRDWADAWDKNIKMREPNLPFCNLVYRARTSLRRNICH